MRSAIEVESALTLILLTSIKSSGNNSLSIDVIVAEAGRSFGALQFLLSSSNINRSFNGIQVVIMPYGTDMILRDLISIGVLAAIANKSRQSDVLFKIALHDVSLICNNVEVGDVNNIITMNSITTVYGLGIGGAHKHLYVSGNGLLRFAILIALCANLFSTSINLLSANTRNGALMSLSQNLVNPTSITLDQLRCARMNILKVREQTIDVVESMRQSILMIISKCFHGALQSHTRCLSHSDDLLLVSMRQDIHRLNSIAVKYVSIHSFISSFRVFDILIFFLFIFFLFIFGIVRLIGIIRYAGILKSLANQSINNSLLLLSKGIKYILYCLFLSGFFSRFLSRLFFLFCIRFCHIIFILLFTIITILIGLFVIAGMRKRFILDGSFILTMS